MVVLGRVSGIAGTGREILTPGRVEELLKPLLSALGSVKTLHLGNKSWGQEAAAAAAAIFRDSDLKSSLEHAGTGRYSSKSLVLSMFGRCNLLLFSPPSKSCWISQTFPI